MWLNESNTVLVLQAAERRHGTINETIHIGELRDWKMTWSKDMSLGPRQRGGIYATQGKIAQVCRRPNGVSDQHLRWNLWFRSLRIYCQSSINESIFGGMVRFEFKIPYKLQVAAQQKTLGILRIDLLHFQVHMNCEFFQDLIVSSTFEQFSKETQALVNSIMSIYVEVMTLKEWQLRRVCRKFLWGAK